MKVAVIPANRLSAKKGLRAQDYIESSSSKYAVALITSNGELVLKVLDSPSSLAAAVETLKATVSPEELAAAGVTKEDLRRISSWGEYDNIASKIGCLFRVTSIS